MSSRLSFAVTSAYSFLTLISTTIIIPTSLHYTRSFGIPANFAGLLVGAAPFASAIAQPYFLAVKSKYQLGRILIGGCAANTAASIAYSLAPSTNVIALGLAARILTGVFSGPAFIVAFVQLEEPSSVEDRLQVFKYSNVVLGFGCAAGPLLGLVIEVICNAAGWKVEDDSVFGTITAPGWLMAALFVVESGAICLWFSDGSRDPDAPRGERLPPPQLPWYKISIYSMLAFMAPLNASCWEMSTVFKGTNSWGWSIGVVAFIVGSANLASASIVALAGNLTGGESIDDFLGLFFSFALAFCASLLYFEYPAAVMISEVLFSVGGALGLLAVLCCRHFLIAGLSKLSPVAIHRKKLFQISLSTYLLGWGTGFTIAPFLHWNSSGLGTCLVAVNVFSILAIGISSEPFILPYSDFIKYEPRYGPHGSGAQTTDPRASSLPNS